MLPLTSGCVPPALERRFRRLLALAFLALLASAEPLFAQSFNIERVTLDSTGVQANAYSPAGALSADGRYVVFRSDATNLVPNDTNGMMDVFVHDRSNRTTTRVSLGTGGVQGNGPSRVGAHQRISRDGRYVVFESEATNLDPGDTNGALDNFVHDRQTGQTTRISTDSTGLQAQFDSGDPHISPDGQFFTFWSASSLARAHRTACT